MTNKTVKSSRTTLAVLEVVVNDNGARLKTIAERLDLPPSTTLGHLGSLVECGYVQKQEDVYRPSLKIMNMSSKLRQSNVEYRLANKYTEKVVRETDHRSIFLVEEDGLGVPISIDAGNYQHWPHERIGGDFYLHTTAGGKVILANLSESRLEDVIDRWGLPRETPHTITSKAELVDELQTVRETNVAFNREETVEGIVAVAVPVTGVDDEFVGALNANALRVNVDREWFFETLPTQLQAIAGEFSREIRAAN